MRNLHELFATLLLRSWKYRRLDHRAERQNDFVLKYLAQKLIRHHNRLVIQSNPHYRDGQILGFRHFASLTYELSRRS